MQRCVLWEAVWVCGCRGNSRDERASSCSSCALYALGPPSTFHICMRILTVTHTTLQVRRQSAKVSLLWSSVLSSSPLLPAAFRMSCYPQNHYLLCSITVCLVFPLYPVLLRPEEKSQRRDGLHWWTVSVSPPASTPWGTAATFPHSHALFAWVFVWVFLTGKSSNHFSCLALIQPEYFFFFFCSFNSASDQVCPC